MNNENITVLKAATRRSLPIECLPETSSAKKVGPVRMELSTPPTRMTLTGGTPGVWMYGPALFSCYEDDRLNAGGALAVSQSTARGRPVTGSPRPVYNNNLDERITRFVVAGRLLVVHIGTRSHRTTSMFSTAFRGDDCENLNPTFSPSEQL